MRHTHTRLKERVDSHKKAKEGLTLTRTLRQNKGEILASCLTKQDLYSSQFLFGGPLTLCSWACKEKKMVVLLSTEQHIAIIDAGERRMLQIITAYNDYKGGDDALDLRIEKIHPYRRKTARWTLNVFFLHARRCYGEFSCAEQRTTPEPFLDISHKYVGATSKESYPTLH